ncbi:monovalent cation:H+ antiporter, CPA1 (nhx1) [Malassezia yamatoensis]|uniref:Sodium/hydrogen exchanger n=1 Tax=Malassezia yamatoensis TaxID=253288 RepID=A0AAJ5YWB0_9BASI|nr:monovalent cation:H+ antiporter, CPA1 (nhx1) [Malassezia yamatoensis]
MGPGVGVSPVLDAEENERFSSLALFLVLFLLIGSFLTSYYLKVKRITAVHETIVGLFAVREMLGFSNTIMMNVLLPPIILASGYDLRQAKFFRNFGTILTFALFGTFISAIVIGVIVWLGSLLRIEAPHLSLLECLIFGSTLSATDPVTILAIFNTYRVDPQLYSIIFGESILNDAVSIVMFETLTKFRNTQITMFSIFYGLALFGIVFSLSMILGVVYGLACSLLLKHSKLGMYPELESCVVLLIAYTSYFFSNAVQMSGIVSLLFCGITLKHYAFYNMSIRTQRTTKYIFQTLASLSENFIFIYLGLSLFTGEHLVYQPILILFTLVAVVASRYCAVFPLAYALNRISEIRAGRRQRMLGTASVPEPVFQLPREYQLMLFWAGLRGAVGFALSAGMVGTNASALQTTVLVVVVLTVIVFGGTTAQMLDVLQIQTGVEDDEDDNSVADLDENLEQGIWTRQSLTPSDSVQFVGRYRDSSAPPADMHAMSATPSASEAPQVMVAGPGGLRNLVREDLEEDDTTMLPDSAMRARHMLDRANVIFQDGQWFQKIDERYLLPMFSNTVANRKHEQRKEQMQARRHATRESHVVDNESSMVWNNVSVPYERSSEQEEFRTTSPKDKNH